MPEILLLLSDVATAQLGAKVSAPPDSRKGGKRLHRPPRSGDRDFVAVNVDATIFTAVVINVANILVIIIINNRISLH